jgi:hypothetical protein
MPQALFILALGGSLLASIFGIALNNNAAVFVVIP